MAKNSEFLSDIKSGAFRVLGTLFGNLAFESLDSIHKNKEFANLGISSCLKIPIKSDHL